MAVVSDRFAAASSSAEGWWTANKISLATGRSGGGISERDQVPGRHETDVDRPASNILRWRKSKNPFLLTDQYYICVPEILPSYTDYQVSYT
jgi:hypothetical protein